jgi:hypothetical protein
VATAFFRRTYWGRNGRRRLWLLTGWVGKDDRCLSTEADFYAHSTKSVDFAAIDGLL